MLLRREDDIFRFDVRVHDAAVVHVADRLEHLPQNRPDIRLWQPELERRLEREGRRQQPGREVLLGEGGVALENAQQILAAKGKQNAGVDVAAAETHFWREETVVAVVATAATAATGIACRRVRGIASRCGTDGERLQDVPLVHRRVVVLLPRSEYLHCEELADETGLILSFVVTIVVVLLLVLLTISAVR